MALQISYEDQYGATHASAYARIVQVDIDLLAATVTVVVYIWVDDAARLASKEIIFRERVQLTIAPNELGANPGQTAYTNLQTIGRYIGAIDV